MGASVAVETSVPCASERTDAAFVRRRRSSATRNFSLSSARRRVVSRAADASGRAVESPSSSSFSSSASSVAFTFRAHEASTREALARRCGAASAAETTTKTNERLGVTTTTEVWRTPRLRRVRSTYVDGGEAAQIFNLVAYPEPSAPDAPLLGVDLICVGKGNARKILIGVDLQPMCRDMEYASAYVPDLLAVVGAGGRASTAAAKLNATTPSNKFYEDAEFFSRGMFFARPESASEDVMRCSLDVVEAYVDVWLARLDEAEREAEAMDGACKFGLALEDVRRCVLTEETARAAQDAHDAWQLTHDPAIPMFASWYGEDWAREFAETVLFPGAKA